MEMEMEMNDSWMAGDEVGDDGAKSISEMLRVNTTLTSLDLDGKDEKDKRKDN